MTLNLLQITQLTHALQRARTVRMPFLITRWARRSLSELQQECAAVAEEERKLAADYDGELQGVQLRFPTPAQEKSFLDAREALVATEVDVNIEYPPGPLAFDMSPADDEVFDIVRKEGKYG